MSHAGYWVIGLVAIFMFGTMMGARVSPREKALGLLRDKAKKMGFIPRLVPAPDWIQQTVLSGKAGGMVAHYSIVLSEATLPLLQARVVDSSLKVIQGDSRMQGLTINPALKGLQALVIQANSAGFYWDEEADLRGEQLETMRSDLISCADRLKSL